MRIGLVFWLFCDYAMTMKYLLSTALLSLASLCHGLHEFLPQGMNYDARITPPADYLGFEPGERHLFHHELTGYLRLLAGESDRMEIIEYGRTHGGRPLMQILISSPDKLAKKESIRKAHRKLADPTQSGRLNLGDMPLVVNINYNVHGNEPSGANAAPLVAHYLSAAKGKAIPD
jgi:hypothetical protein